MRHVALFPLALALAGSGLACSDVPAPQRPRLLVSGPGTPFGIAADGQAVYFTSAGDADGGKLLKLVGGAEVAQEIATGLVNPFDVAGDAVRVYWTELGTTSGDDGAVRAAGKSGGTPAALASAQRAPRAVVSDGTSVYWIDSAGSILRATLPDGAPEKLTDARAEALAVAADDVFWTDSDTGKVMSMPKVAGDAVELAAGQPRPRGIALTDDHVYWIVLGSPAATGADDGDDAAAPTGEVRRVSRAGGAVQTIAPAQSLAGLGALAVDGSGAYWLTAQGTETSVVRSTLPAASPPEVLATGLAEGQTDDLPLQVLDLTTDATNVYWTTTDGLSGSILTVEK